MFLTVVKFEKNKFIKNELCELGGALVEITSCRV